MLTDYMLTLGQQAKSAAQQMACASTEQKNAALQDMATRLEQGAEDLLAANAKDLEQAAQSKLSAALVDRLSLTALRIAAMSDGLRQVAKLPDPVGQMGVAKVQDSGIKVAQMRVPLGVVGIIYESRPNVTADAAGLCLKSGNACILRGGSEAIHSNLAIANYIRDSLQAVALPANAVQLVNTTDRQAVGELLAMSEYVDIIIPRGGKGLIERIASEARMPVIKHLDGICHVYIDDRADLAKAIRIAYNAKTQRYGTCNTMECLLVAAGVAEQVLPALFAQYQQAGVEIHGCERAREYLPEIIAATDSDYATEWLAPVLSLKIVDDLTAAIQHIAQYGSQHTDAIVTEDEQRAQRFLREVDSSSVMVNTSTRFADGYEYGLGAEIGISTDKFHARGPVGLEGLTSQKFVVTSDGCIRE